MPTGLYDIPSWATNETRSLAKLSGVEKLFEPQYMALETGVERGENLVVAAPTGSGKTFIALVAIVNGLARRGGRAFYLVPLKSVAYEKYSSFSILARMGFRVKISVGDFREGPPEAPVTIATYESSTASSESPPVLLAMPRLSSLTRSTTSRTRRGGRYWRASYPGFSPTLGRRRSWV